MIPVTSFLPGSCSSSVLKFMHPLCSQLQDSDVPFPLLGVCQGYELLMYLAANNSSSSASKNILTACDARNVALPLVFRPGFEESQLYKHASSEIIDILATLPVTSNHHE